jgi:hypothetical protein
MKRRHKRVKSQLLPRLRLKLRLENIIPAANISFLARWALMRPPYPPEFSLDPIARRYSCCSSEPGTNKQHSSKRMFAGCQRETPCRYVFSAVAVGTRSPITRFQLKPVAQGCLVYRGPHSNELVVSSKGKSWSRSR